GQVVVQRLAAAPVDVPHRGTDLRVGIAIDLLLQEIDQAAVALQDRQDPQVRTRRRPREERLDPRPEVALPADPPERSQRQHESVQRDSPVNRLMTRPRIPPRGARPPTTHPDPRPSPARVLARPRPGLSSRLNSPVYRPSPRLQTKPPSSRSPSGSGSRATAP